MLHYTQNGEAAALITNIQKYTIHDGPGIRTALFFKGCTMSCLWCSNPETIAPQRELGCYPEKCLTLSKCGRCQKTCPSGSRHINFDESGALSGAENCPDGFICAEACPPRALKIWGEYMTVPEMMKIILEDRSFYARTGGGVTLNGGEVLLQWEIATELLRECKNVGINTCVETALHCPFEHAEAVFEYTDLVISDIKHMDSERHREITGAGNERILQNLKKTVEMGKKLVLRTPVVPGYNADIENIRKTGEFIRDELGGKIIAYQLLPYRKMGTEKYDSLGIDYPMGDYEPPERADWEENLLFFANLLQTEYGLPAVAGSGEKLKI